MLINDRFHVQQLVSEAIDQMRIGLRWEVLAEENKAIKEHRAKRKAAHTRAEKDLIGEWVPERMENGETKPQIMAQPSYNPYAQVKVEHTTTGKGKNTISNVPTARTGIQHLS